MERNDTHHETSTRFGERYQEVKVVMGFAGVQPHPAVSEVLRYKRSTARYPLFDHAINPRDQCWIEFDAEGPGGLQIDHQLEYSGALNR